jgi:hypothetical protein
MIKRKDIPDSKIRLSKSNPRRILQVKSKEEKAIIIETQLANEIPESSYLLI